MNWIKKILVLSVALFMLCAYLPTSAAPGVPVFDVDGSGSVSIALVDTEGHAVPDAEFSFYRVAKPIAHEGFEFKIEPAFDGSVFSLYLPGLNELDVSAAQVEAFGTFIHDHAIPADFSGVTDADGNMTVSSVPFGLYYVVQTGTPDQWLPTNPFLISLPVLNSTGTAYLSDVSATPKVTPPEYIPPVIPNPPDDPNPPSEPPSGPNLPSTGQLWWPVPALASAGIFLFILGWCLRRRSHD